MALLGPLASFAIACAASSLPSAPVDVTDQTLAAPHALARLQAPGEVFFREDFEAPHCLDRWYNLIGEDERRVRLVSGAGVAHTGARALRLDTVDRSGSSCGAGVSYWFPPGRERVHFRRYIRFADNYDQGMLHHVGGGLDGVAGEDRWGQMGKAGTRPKGDDRFAVAFEPWRDWGRHDPPGAMMLYTYWMDMKRDPDGHFWGNMFAPPAERQVTLKRGVWHCLEQMIQVNTPGEPDGEMAAWIDGKLYVHLKGFRWRTTDGVTLKRIDLGLYVHQSTRTNTVWYDDVVLSSGYIGPERANETSPLP